MKTKWWIPVLIFSLAINAAAFATVGYHYYHSTFLAPSILCPVPSTDRHLYQALGLSDLQLSKMAPLAQSFHGRLAELGAVMEGKKERLIDLLRKDSDPVAIERLRNEMAGIQDEIQNEVIVHIMETKKILDPAQRERFFHLMRQSMRGTNSWLGKTGGNE